MVPQECTQKWWVQNKDDTIIKTRASGWFRLIQACSHWHSNVPTQAWPISGFKTDLESKVFLMAWFKHDESPAQMHGQPEWKKKEQEVSTWMWWINCRLSNWIPPEINPTGLASFNFEYVKNTPVKYYPHICFLIYQSYGHPIKEHELWMCLPGSKLQRNVSNQNSLYSSCDLGN